MAVMSPNQFWEAQELFRKPHNYVHFAGTETSTEWYGYM
jgi:monoamine oxidase